MATATVAKERAVPQRASAPADDPPAVVLELGRVQRAGDGGENRTNKPGWYAVYIRIGEVGGRPYPDVLKDEGGAATAELERVRAEFFESGAGRPLTDALIRLGAAEKEEGEAAALIAQAQRAWDAALGSGGDPSAVEAELAKLRANHAVLSARLTPLRQAVERAKEEARPKLAAAVRARLDELRAAAEVRQFTAKKAAEVPSSWPIAELILSQAAASGVELAGQRLGKLTKIE